MKKAAFAVFALAVVYLLVALVLAAGAAKKSQGFSDELARLEGLAKKAEFPPPTAELATACTSLERTSRLGLAALYLPPPETTYLSSDAKERFPSRLFVAFNPEDFRVETLTLPHRPDGLTYFLEDLLGDVPTAWSWRSERWSAPLKRPLDPVRYLVVHQLDSLTLPVVGATSYEPGVMKFRSAVLDAKSGAVLCSGSTTLEQHGTVHVAGSGATMSDAEQRVEQKKESEVLGMFFIDTHFFALRDVCWLGDEKLCTETFGTWRAP